MLETDREEFRAKAYEAIRRCARVERLFTTDHVWSELGRYGRHVPFRSMLGNVMKQAERAGIIEKTSHWMPSHRAVAHQRQLRVWKSQVYRHGR